MSKQNKIDVNKILKFEEEYKLKDRKIYGINYWYCRRTRTLNDIISISCGQQGMCDKVKFKFFNPFLKKNYFGKDTKNTEILLVTDARRIKQGKKFESIYTDEVEKIIKNKYSCLTIEEPSWTCYTEMKKSHHYNCMTENIRYVDWYEFGAKIKSIFFKLFNKRKLKNIENEVQNLINDINSYFGIDINEIKKDYVEHIIYFIQMKKVYSKLIDYINPKCVIFYYRDFPFKTLIEMICKEKKIITIEMQHGTYTEDEPIEKKGDSSAEWLNEPDYLFSFGKLQTFEQNIVYPKNKIKYIGNLFLERKIEEQYEEPYWFDKTKKYILFISQSSIGEYISKMASELSSKIDDSYIIIYKYHPNESARNYKNLDKDNIIQIKDGTEEIYKYQKIAFAQVGVSSTAIFEGISFKIPTILLKNPEETNGIEKILRKLKKGIYFASKSNQIVKILETNLEKPYDKDIDLLWEKNSRENFINEIEIIIK